MQLGFLRGFNSLGRFAGPPRNLNYRVLLSVQMRSVGPKNEAVMLGSTVGSNMPSRNGHAKENGKVSTLDISSIKDDPAKLDHMKVEELRTMLRDFGASTKGRKHELISRLICVMDGKVEGECSLAEDREIEVFSEKIDTLHAGITSVGKRKNQVVPESVKVQKGNRKKHLVTDNSGSVESKIEAVVASQKNVTETVKAPVKRPSSKRKPAAETSTKQTEASAAAEDMSANEPWTRFAHKKPQKDWVAYNPRTMRPPSVGQNVKSVKVVSWNVNGLRALLKVEGFSAVELAKRENFDVLCLQETKLQDKDVEKVKDMLEGFEHSFWTCSTSKLGYSGTAIISRIKPLSVKFGLGISDHDSEGRLVTAEFDSFYLLNAYVPNSGDGLRRLSYRVSEWDASLSSYMKELEKTKPVILTGDLNCAHQEIDIYNPAGNKRSAGFTDEERQSFENNFLSKGFVDTFRQLHPGVVGYTYWGYRHGGRKTNKGWRLDYFLVSQTIANNVHDSYILPDITGSDHSPIGLILRL